MSDNPKAAERVIAFVDGFNLYHGLRDRYHRKYLWLDLERVASELLKPGQELVAVRYFTAAVRNDPGAQQRQQAYLGALRSRPLVDIHLGRFQEKHPSCNRCGHSWRSYEEKETDVSIAVALVEDGVAERFDVALLISADSDLCPAVRALKRLCPTKRVIAVFPPKRHSGALGLEVDAAFTLGQGVIRRSILPQTVIDAKGVQHKRPPTWS